MTDDLISDNLVRALRYVAMINDGGEGVKPSDLDQWVGLPEPDEVDIQPYGLGSAVYRMWSMIGRSEVSEYIRLVGWGHGDPLFLTAVGRAIVKVHENRRPEVLSNERALVILSPEDPLNLVALTGAVAAAKAGMLVDPYFTDDLFAWLLEATSIERVLLCRQESKRATLRLAAGAAERAGRTLEIRCLRKGEIHDRYLVGEDGDVSSIGASLNGLNKNFTTISPMPEPAAGAVQGYLDEKWDAAVRIEAQLDLRVAEQDLDEVGAPTAEA